MYKSPLEEMMGTGLHEVEYKAGAESDISNILVNSGIAVSAALLASGIYWVSKKVFGHYFKDKEKEKQDKKEKKTKNNETLYKQFSIPTDETNVKEVLERVQKVIDKTNSMIKGKEHKFSYIKFICRLMGRDFKVKYSMEETKSNVSKMFKTEFMSEMKSDYITPDGKVMFFNINTCNILDTVDEFQDFLKGLEVSFGKTKEDDELIIIFRGPKGAFGFQKKDRDKHLETYGELGQMLVYIFDNFDDRDSLVWTKMIFDCLYEGLADNRMWIQWCFEENLFNEFGFPKKDTEYYIRPNDWEWGYLTTFVALKKKTDDVGTESVIGTEGLIDFIGEFKVPLIQIGFIASLIGVPILLDKYYQRKEAKEYAKKQALKRNEVKEKALIIPPEKLDEHFSNVDSILKSITGKLRGKEKEFPFISLCFALNGMKFNIQPNIDKYDKQNVSKLLSSEEFVYYGIKMADTGKYRNIEDMMNDISIQAAKDKNGDNLLIIKGSKDKIVFSENESYSEKDMKGLGISINVFWEHFADDGADYAIESFYESIMNDYFNEVSDLSDMISRELYSKLGINEKTAISLYEIDDMFPFEEIPIVIRKE
jgi:hypothetical protein